MADNAQEKARQRAYELSSSQTEREENTRILERILSAPGMVDGAIELVTLSDIRHVREILDQGHRFTVHYTPEETPYAYYGGREPDNQPHPATFVIIDEWRALKSSIDSFVSDGYSLFNFKEHYRASNSEGRRVARAHVLGISRSLHWFSIVKRGRIEKLTKVMDSENSCA